MAAQIYEADPTIKAMSYILGIPLILMGLVLGLLPGVLELYFFVFKGIALSDGMMPIIMSFSILGVIGYILLFHVPFKIILEQETIVLFCGFEKYEFDLSKVKKIESLLSYNRGYRRSFVGYLMLKGHFIKRFFLIPWTKAGYGIVNDIKKFLET